MSRRKGQIYSAEQKTRIVLELLKEEQTTSQIASKYKITSQSLSKWKQQFLDNATLATDVLGEALAKYPKPKIFNSDQGSQYTSYEHTKLLTLRTRNQYYLTSGCMKIDYLELYIDYLISGNGYATATGLSAMIDNEISHDQIKRFLSKMSLLQKNYEKK